MAAGRSDMQSRLRSVSLLAVQRGVSMMEVLVTLTIIGILAAIALPSFNEMIEGQRLKGAAELLASDLRWARGEAIKRGVKVRFTFTSGGVWTYSVIADTSGDESFSDEIKRVSANDFPRVELVSPEEGRPIKADFEPFRATAINLLNDNLSVGLRTSSLSARVRLNEVGAVDICGIRGYESCVD